MKFSKFRSEIMSDDEVGHFWKFINQYLMKLFIIKVFEFSIHLFFIAISNGKYTIEPINGLKYPSVIILFHTIYYNIIKRA